MVTGVMEGESAAGNEPVLSEGNSKEEVETEELSLEELLESVEKLSADSIEMEDPSKETGVSMQEKEEIIEEEPVSSDTDMLGQMIQEVEFQNKGEVSQPPLEDEESVQEGQNFEDDIDIYAEVQAGNVENLDDLDSAFKEIVAEESKQVFASGLKESEISNLGSIIPEPEDLLERIAPSVFSEKERRPQTAEEIQENINSMTDPSSFSSVHYKDSISQENDDRFIQFTEQQARQIIEKSLGTSLQQEISGMSEIITKTVREVVREIIPDIARSVIREEIDKIKRI